MIFCRFEDADSICEQGVLLTVILRTRQTYSPVGGGRGGGCLELAAGLPHVTVPVSEGPSSAQRTHSNLDNSKRIHQKGEQGKYSELRKSTVRSQCPRKRALKEI